MSNDKMEIVSFEWSCSDCRCSGTVRIGFPCHPSSVLDVVMGDHHKHEQRRHCMCPAHMLKIKPKYSPPVPELEGTFPLVLYFRDMKDQDDFIDIVKQAKPGMKTLKL